MTKQYWLDEIDKAGTDVILVNNIVLAAGRDREFHGKGEDGFAQYSEIMNKGMDIIMEHATPDELAQISDDNLFAAKIALVNMLLSAAGIKVSLFGDDEDGADDE